MVKGQVLCTQIHATAGIEPISQNSSGSTLGVMMTLDMLTRTYSWPKVSFDVFLFQQGMPHLPVNEGGL